MKARYNFWSDRPRNVTRREYHHYQLMVVGTIMTSGFSALTAFLAVSGFSGRLRGTEEIPSMSVAEAASYGSNEPTALQPTDVVKLQGFLVADNKLTMPDNPDLQVIRGRVLLKAEAGRGDDLIHETLFEWDQEATKVFLSDGQTRVPIAFDLAKIPMQEDRMTRAKVRYAGESSRLSKPVALEYAEQIYPVSQVLKDEGSISARLTRKYFPDGQSVVLVAAVEATPNGGQLVDPLGQRLQVIVGTETQIAQDDSKMRIVLGLFSIVLGISAYFFKKAQGAKWQEFIEQSNQ